MPAFHPFTYGEYGLADLQVLRGAERNPLDVARRPRELDHREVVFGRPPHQGGLDYQLDRGVVAS